MWAKIDDKLFGHPKWLATSTPGKALWVSALSWCASQENDGQVPAHVLPLLGSTKAAARSLVASGLWEEVGGGWQFHDWVEYQPDGASVRAKRAAESDGGRRGAHARWHVKKGIWVPECQFCQESGPPDGVPHEVPNGVSMGGGQWGANAPGPDPARTRIPTDVGSTGTPRNARASDEQPEPNPQPEMSVNSVLAAAGLAQHERRDFLVDLKGNGTRNTTALVNALHRDGKLARRIAEWRDERNLAAEAAARPKPGQRTTSDRVREGIDLAVRLAEQEAAAELPDNVHPFRQIEGA